MDIIHNGDSVVNTVPTTKQKALKINLNENIYGSFAEIGAGQETVRQFFRAGGASSTIAKSMSAYDKDFSDAIYGIENDKRYVTEKRLRKMLVWETNLIEKRLTRDKHPDKLFFSFANTVATIDFAKKFKEKGNYVVADFICPTPEARGLFSADYIVWVDTIKEGRFEDTNKMFIKPEKFDFHVTTQDAVFWAPKILLDIKKK